MRNSGWGVCGPYMNTHISNCIFMDISVYATHIDSSDSSSSITNCVFIRCGFCLRGEGGIVLKNNIASDCIYVVTGINFHIQYSDFWNNETDILGPVTTEQ
jgi:hypothetical protein